MQDQEVKQEYQRLYLPSVFRTYEGVDPEKVGIRTFKGKDEKMIASLSYENFESKFNDIFSGVIVGLDVKNMTLGDRLYVLLWEVINSYSKTVPFNHTCSEGTCRFESTYEVDLTEIAVAELSDKYKEPIKTSLSNGNTVDLRLLTVKDELKVSEYEKNFKEDGWLYRYALTIVDDSKKDLEKLAFISELSSADVATIRAHQEVFFHGPKMEVRVTCSKCGAQEVVPLPFRIEYILPNGPSLRAYFRGAV